MNRTFIFSEASRFQLKGYNPIRTGENNLMLFLAAQQPVITTAAGNLTESMKSLH